MDSCVQISKLATLSHFLSFMQSGKFDRYAWYLPNIRLFIA